MALCILQKNVISLLRIDHHIDINNAMIVFRLSIIPSPILLALPPPLGTPWGISSDDQSSIKIPVWSRPLTGTQANLGGVQCLSSSNRRWMACTLSLVRPNCHSRNKSFTWRRVASPSTRRRVYYEPQHALSRSRHLRTGKSEAQVSILKLISPPSPRFR